MVAATGNVVTATASDNATSDVASAAMLSATGAVGITANSTRSATSNAKGNTYGAVAIGVNIATTTVNGATRAFIDDNANIPATPDIVAGTLNLAAGSTDTGNSTVNASAGGLLSLTPSQGNTATTTVSPNVSTYLGVKRFVRTTGDVNITAADAPSGNAHTTGTSGGGINVTGSISTATVNPTLASTVRDNAIIQSGGGISVTAKLTNVTSSVDATGSSGAIVGVSVNNSILNMNLNVAAGIGASDTLSAIKDITVSTKAAETTNATGNNSSGGAVAVGTVQAQTNLNVANAVSVGAGDVINAGGNFTLSADSTGNSNNASTTASGGGFVKLGDAISTLAVTDTTSAAVGAANITAGNNLVIQSTTGFNSTHNASVSGSARA